MDSVPSKKLDFDSPSDGTSQTTVIQLDSAET